MAPEELDAILARAEAATPGPWEVYPTSPPVGSSWLLSGEVSIGMMAPKGGAGSQDHLADAEFCAHARTDVPALVAEVRRLKAALAAARALCGEAADVTENVFTVASARLRAEAAKGEA